MPIAADDPRLLRWLHEHLPGRPGTLRLAPLAASGDSNLMVAIESDAGRWVLRAPPTVKNHASAHDVLREHRLLTALETTSVPHARPVAACPDPEVVGSVFYVMEHVDGASPDEPLPAPFAADPATRRAAGPRAAEALAELGRVPWRDLDLAGFGRPDGFLARQVPRWRAQLDGYRSRPLPGLDETGAWLEAHRPPDAEPAILHGDFGLRNVMFAPTAPARVAAVVDWEMATIGDPLLDVGLLLATWSHPGEDVLLNRSATHLPGMATRAEVAAAYTAHGGRSLDRIDYYMALALYKFAAILEGSYARFLAGDSEHAGHAAYAHMVPAMARRAHAITRGAWGIAA